MLISILFSVKLEAEGAGVKKSLLKKTNKSHSSNSNSSTYTLTNETSTTVDDDEEDKDDIDFYYRTKSKQPSKPEWIFYLHAPDERDTIEGNWTYYINHQRMQAVQRISVGSQSITIPLANLNPDQENQIRVQFQGKVDGRPYAADQTYTLPSFSLSYQAGALQLKYKGTDENSLGDGKFMITVRNAKQQVVANCQVKAKPQLDCKLSKLSPGQYQVVATYLRKNAEFAFRKLGKLVVKANRQSVFTPEPADRFPDLQQVKKQQAQDQWDSEWQKWEQKKIASPSFPKFTINLTSSMVDVKLVPPDEEEELDKEYMLIAFYNEENQLMDACGTFLDYESCKIPEQTPFKLTVMFVGKMYEQNFPIGLVQNGTYQDGRLTLATPQYTRDAKTVKSKISAIEKQEKLADHDWNLTTTDVIKLTLFVLIIIVSFVIGIIEFRKLLKKLKGG